ncbi:MAG: ribbon-helix-helix domain-containing protein [Gammaproteobacteria bacterium]|nr:ribbon-helix-helix domain-containing protein [Gammaproteobacteria bacterium]
MQSARWNLAVSLDTDRTLRMFLASNNSGKKGDLSKFVEEAVRSRIFYLTAQQAKANNTEITETDLQAIVDEAISWARS